MITVTHPPTPPPRLPAAAGPPPQGRVSKCPISLLELFSEENPRADAAKAATFAPMSPNTLVAEGLF